MSRTDRSTKAPGEPSSRPDARTPVVGIAASAGGLEALIALCENLPAGTGAAFVVLFHLLPGSPSHLPEILGRATELEILPAADGTRLGPDRIYVVASDRRVELRDGVIRARGLGPGRERRWPVDDFFASLAEDLGHRAVVVLLSGSGSTGVRGLAHVRAEGGLTVVQEPESAAHDAMPRSAIAAGVADVVAPPAEIPAALASYLGRLDELEAATAEERATSSLSALITLVRAHRGRDFSRYKKPTLLRRLRRRIGLSRCADLEEYLELLRRDPEELDALVSDLTIKVSGFFRDPEAWEALEKEVVAPLIEERREGSELRVWVPACATGEEAYSLAILLSEHAARVQKPLELKIFATDADEAALQVARHGRYPEGSVAPLSRERLERFFTADGPVYRVRKELRDCVVFSPHDLLQDPPFSRMDLVSCRNFLIYVEPAVQKKVVARFHFALREGGSLFLGKSESVGDRWDLFEPVSKRWRIYRRLSATGHDEPEEELAAFTRELERRVEERTAHVRLLQDVATIANAAVSPEKAFADALARVCEFKGWILGHVYWVSEAGRLEPGEIWYVRPGAGKTAEQVRAYLGTASLERGESLAGRVLAAREARWSGGAEPIRDPRLGALEDAGVVAGVAFPVLAGDEVVAVMELFSDHPVEPGEALVGIMANVGTQLGRVVERARVERRLAELTLQEQQRLGEELHEGLGQQVTGLSILARSLHQKLSEAGRPEAELSGQLVEHFKAARDQVKDLAEGLMPVRVQERGLEAALLELVDEVCRAYGVDCRLEMEAVEVSDERLATAIYRIAREAVNNALLHADPQTVIVRIFRRDGELVLEVTDDGGGFPAGADVHEGLGLKIMRDRASLVGGELVIEDNDGGGTRVRCAFPEGRGRGLR